MVLQPPLLAAIPSGGLDMTADFVPLFMVWVIVGLCVLGLTVATAIHDTRTAKRTTKQVTESEPSFPKAA